MAPNGTMLARAVSLESPEWHKLEKPLAVEITSRLHSKLSSGQPVVKTGKHLEVFLGSIRSFYPRVGTTSSLPATTQSRSGSVSHLGTGEEKKKAVCTLC